MELVCFLQSLQAKNLAIRRLSVEIYHAKESTLPLDCNIFGLLLLIIAYFKEDDAYLYRKVWMPFLLI